MNYEVYHIPTNFTDAGRVMGLFELRNLVEAVLLTLPALYLCIAFLPLDLTPKIIVTLTIIVPLGGFGLIGISDDSMTRWLGSWWKWRRSRRIDVYKRQQRKCAEDPRNLMYPLQDAAIHGKMCIRDRSRTANTSVRTFT